MNQLYIIIIILFALALILRGGLKGFKGLGKYRYKRKDFLMSRAEHEFFDVLTEVIGSQYCVFPQIHLSTILNHKIVGQNWKGAFSHINQKSIDFVICDKAYIKPLLAIELDDRTHESENRMERDEEVEKILNDAGLFLLRVRNNGNFNKEEIRHLVLGKLQNNQTT